MEVRGRDVGVGGRGGTLVVVSDLQDNPGRSTTQGPVKGWVTCLRSDTYRGRRGV